MDKEIKSFVSTKRTFDMRRHEATMRPTRENCYSLAQAGWALSMARVRLLRLTDKHGHLLLSSQRQAAAMRQALISYTRHDSGVQQMALEI